ncbi:MAG: OB-fold domain-containing protein [Dehalococcoidia bacterium]
MTQDMISQRPLPATTELTEPFWSAAKERRLVLQRCDDCAAYRFPPEVACGGCGSRRTAWTQVSGRATLYSWTVAHPPLLPFFAERAPWPVVAVQLEEGPRMVTNVVDVPVEDYAAGLPVQVDFEEVDDEVTLVVFRRRATGTGS